MTTPMERITIASAQDFLDALDRHPQFKTAVLRQLLTEALLMLPERFDRFEDRFDRFEAENAQRHERTDARLKNLEGSAYEAKIHIKLMARCITRHGFEEAEEALSQAVPHSSKLQRTVNAAVREGRITPEERAELLLADVIISAEQNRHMVAEASLTAADHDITRAAARARAMRAATGGEVIAAVAAENIDGRQRDLARQLDVEVIVIPG